MKESLNFYYDGVYSVDMNIYNVNSSSGLFEEFFLPTREIMNKNHLEEISRILLKLHVNPYRLTYDFILIKMLLRKKCK